jgi:hypothetical protein
MFALTITKSTPPTKDGVSLFNWEIYRLGPERPKAPPANTRNIHILRIPLSGYYPSCNQVFRTSSRDFFPLDEKAVLCNGYPRKIRRLPHKPKNGSIPVAFRFGTIVGNWSEKMEEEKST